MKDKEALGLATNYAACMEACAAYCEVRRPSIREPGQAAALLAPLAEGLTQEVFWVLLLDTQRQLIGAPIEVTRGLLNSSPVHPREIFRAAVRESADAIIIAHNHPSGNPTPSTEDLVVTHQLVEASRILGIRIIDHIIIGRRMCCGEGETPTPGYVSLRVQGLVNFD